MLSKLKHSVKQVGTSKAVKGTMLTMTSLLFLLKPAISKSNEQLKAELIEALNRHPVEWRIPEIQTTNTNDIDDQAFNQAQNTLIGGPDAFSFALDNVSKYYPDMKDHLTTMLNSFRDKEHKDTTLALLNKMIEKITDPAQKTGAIIYALEMTVFNKEFFVKRYDSKITDTTFKYISSFDDNYKKRFKGYYTRFEANIETIKNKIKQKEINLKQGLQEIESIMNNFSPNDIKTSEYIKKLVSETQELFISSNYPFSGHTKILFDALK